MRILSVVDTENVVELARDFDIQLDSDDLNSIETVLAHSRDLYRLIGDCGDEYRR